MKNIRIGEKYFTNNNEEFIIIEDFGTTNITIQFNDGTIIYKQQYGNIKIGNIKNPNFPHIYNAGYFGIGKYSAKNNPKFYNIWIKLLQRCYDKKYHLKYQTYINCSIDENWKNFQMFAEWCENNYIDGFVLDKDILFKGNKVYSPVTCCFVPAIINTLFTKCDKARGDLPIGVSKNGKKFTVKINKYGESFNYTGFVTPELAFKKYKFEKETYIKYVANLHKNKIPNIVYQAMINYIVEITD